MEYKKRLPLMGIASLVTATLYYFVIGVTNSIVFNLENTFGYTLGLLLAVFVSMLGMVVSNLPSATLFWFMKYPNALVVAIVASIEGFLIFYLAAPMAMAIMGIRVWKIAVFAAVLVGYLVADRIINASKQPVKSKVILMITVLACTALLLALFLKG